MKILLIEDDCETASYVARGLREHGHSVDLASDGHEGLMLAIGDAYDALIVDRMLPKLDGLALLKALRASAIGTPVLLLTAMGGIGDKVQGFEAGGDDYLVKPFAFAELLARVQSLGRRPPLASQDKLHAGDIIMDLIKRRVSRAGQEIDLQPTEFRLLEFLLRNADRVVTRTMLLESVWNFHFDPKTNIVETHISRLRSKIDRGFSSERIRTVRGSGYVLDAH
ncbi:MAG TPA: response regulator transcription factor [Xanthomonadales bacterium]|jgi:two-component system OmpR family response regulator|nr:response regulator transcription factor [Xanthomonadales bacterium]